jgi:hypothetical protein
LEPSTSWNDLLLRLAERLNGSSLQFNTEVVLICEIDPNYWVVVDKANRTYTATCVIVAVDCKNFNQLGIRLLQQPNDVIILKSAARASLVSFIANYDDLEWENSMLNAVRDQMVVYAVGENKLQGWMVLPNDSLLASNPSAVVLTQIFNIFENSRFLPHSWAYKAWPINLPNSSMLTLNQLANNLIWASSESATYGAGYLNGAVQSGLKSAALALLCVRPQTITWQDVREIESATKLERPGCVWMQRQVLHLSLPNSLTCLSALAAIITVVGINKLIHVAIRR